MLPMDDYERLSRYRAGELSEAEAAQVRAALQNDPSLLKALRRLERLDALSSRPAEPAALSAADEALISRVVAQRTARTEPRARRWGPLLVAAGVGALFAAAAVTLVLRGSGDRASGAQPALVQDLGANGPSPVEAGPDQPSSPGPAKAPLHLPLPNGGRIIATGDTQIGLRHDGTVVLFDGTAFVRSDQVPVAIDTMALIVRGEALITTEGERAYDRAKEAAPTRDLSRHLAVFPGWSDTKAAVLSLEGEYVLRLPDGERRFKAGESSILRATGATSATGAAKQAQEGTPQKGIPAASSPREAMVGKDVHVSGGRLDVAAVHKVMLSAAPELAACFEAGLKQTPNLRGQLTLQLTVVRGSDHGQLTDATVKDDYSLANPFVVSCFLQKLAALKWPQPEPSRAVLEYPLGFEARGESESAGTTVLYPEAASERRDGPVVFNTDRAARQDIQLGQAASLGSEAAKVAVVVFSDFECSFCLKAFPTLRALHQKYGDRIRVAYKHKPLPSHPNARLTAAASIAAEEQGRFWEYGELLVKHPGAHDRSALERYAAQLGLDLLRFRAALESDRVRARIDADLAESERVGAKGIPTFFINGREIVGARPIEQYERLIDEELAR